MAAVAERVDTSVIKHLKQAVRGAVILPGESGYEERRAIWNGMIDNRPALVVQPAGVADVMAVVNVVRDRQIPVSIRGGGHNVSGTSVADGGVMLDMLKLKSIRVDPGAKTVRAEAGVTWGEFDAETQAFGLACNGGQISTTGIAGLTLGGGIGHLMRKVGLTIDNLISVDIVTADGTLRHASESVNPDLFWAVRGGGGNFGVVTSFEFRLHEIGPMVFGGMIAYPFAMARDVVRYYREWALAAADELDVTMAFMTAPPAPFVPPHMHFQKAVAFLLCHTDLAEGEKVATELRQKLTAELDMLGPIPYVVQQTLLDEAAGWGKRVYLKSQHLTSLDDAVIDILVDSFAKVPSPETVLPFNAFGGAVARVDSMATAYGFREIPFDLQIFSAWHDPAEDDANITWTRDLHDRLRPYTHGVYVNEMGLEGIERIREAYLPEAFARLQGIKAKYDPDNVFHLNQNIPPA